jgi:hypothetical protein
MLISYNNNNNSNLDSYHPFPPNPSSSAPHTYSPIADHNQFGLVSSSNQGQSNQESHHSNFAVPQNTTVMSEADRKRAHHNALERKRRDHIKDSFHTLRDAIPNIKGEKVSVSKINLISEFLLVGV